MVMRDYITIIEAKGNKNEGMLKEWSGVPFFTITKNKERTWTKHGL